MPEPPQEHEVDHRNWAYGVGKRDAEDVLRAAHARTGFPYVSLRMPMINSARDHYRRLANYLLRILDGAPLLLPEDELPVRHVYGSDVIAATLLAAEPVVPAGTEVNVSQDETLTLEQMLQRIADAAGRPLSLRRVPRARLAQHQLLPACSPYSDPWMSALDNTRSKAVLGIRYTSAARYIPVLVAAQRHLTAADVPGYAQRPAELTLLRG
jgi:nucleoside-diphosphate-sugar epimerase